MLQMILFKKPPVYLKEGDVVEISVENAEV